MLDDTREQDRHEAPLNENEDRAPSRRNILLGSSALVAAATMTSGALAQAQKATPARIGGLRPPDASRTFWSSGATMSASRTSAPTRTV